MAANRRRSYGSGSIRAYRDGFRIQWRDTTGTRKSRVLRPSTNKQADTLLRSILEKVKHGIDVEPEKPFKAVAEAIPKAIPEVDETSRIVTFADLWREHMAQQEVSVKASTYRNLQTLSRTALGDLMAKDLSAIDQRLMDGWWRSQKAHPVNRRNAYFQIQKAFRLAVKWKIIPAIPFEIDNAGKDVSKPRPTFTVSDMDRVLEHLPQLYKDPVEMIFSAHLRISELVGLNASDYRDGWVIVTKQRSQLGVTSGPKYEKPKQVELLERGKIAMDSRPRKIGNAPLFEGARGNRITHAAFRNAWKMAVEAAGLNDFHLHDVRHIGLSFAAEHAHPVVVQERAGHSSFTSTRRYLHADKRQHAEAVERMNETLRRLA